MTFFKKKTGMTLTELLVSVVLIGIVMLGMVSIDYATKQSQQTTTRASLVAMQTGAMMLEITKAVSLATGNTTNVGIQSSTAAAPFNGPTELCVRQDLNLAGTPNNTPNDLTDDTWVCYTVNANRLFTCRGAAPAACNPASSLQLGGLVSIALSIVADTALAIQNFYVGVTITNRYTPTAAADYLNNPQYVLQSRVYPGQHSWSIP